MPAPLLPEEHVTVEMDNMDSKIVGPTPGPWRAETHEKSGIIYIMGKLTREEAVNMLGDGVVAEIDASDCTDDGMFPPRDPEAEANARLIAAAPELLEAAKAHEEWERKEKQGPQYPEGVSRDNGGEAIWRAWWDEQLALCSRAENLTRAAIAKAETR